VFSAVDFVVIAGCELRSRETTMGIFFVVILLLPMGKKKPFRTITLYKAHKVPFPCSAVPFPSTVSKIGQVGAL
jgi:hypothetical protein